MAELVSDALRKLLGEWERFEVERVERDAEGDDVFGAPAPRLVLVLRAQADGPTRCSQCGAIVEKIHDVRARRVRDLPLGEWDTWLVFSRARLQCPRCGPTVEAVPWLDRDQRMTTRLAEKMARRCSGPPRRHSTDRDR